MGSSTPLFDKFVLMLYHLSMHPHSSPEFGYDEIEDQLGDTIGPAAIRPLVSEALDQGLIRKIKADPIEFEFTYKLIEAASGIEQEAPPSSHPSTKGSFSKFKDSLLVDLAKTESTHGTGYYDLQEIADEVGLLYEDGWLRKAAISFRDNGLINDSFTSSGYSGELTGEGLEEAQELMGQMGLHSSTSQETIPASDRVVKRSDNEEAWSQAAEGVVALRDAMTVANDYGDLDDDEFEQKLSEVRALQVMLDAPQVQWDMLDQLTTKAVKYLAMKFVDNAIGLAASRLIVYLMTLL